MPCFCRCLWKCPVENSPTASFPFSPSLKCPQNCPLLACAAVEPRFGPPAQKKAPVSYQPLHFQQLTTRGCSAPALRPSYSQGAVDSGAFAVGGQFQEQEHSATFRLCLCTMPLLGFQLHEIQTDRLTTPALIALLHLHLQIRHIPTTVPHISGFLSFSIQH